MKEAGPIGIFDSGYGGLTVFKEIANKLPEYDFLYLGDNARVPYGTRSFETVYRYTLECVQHLFDMGCHLIILACNTASAKALRTIQQKDLPKMKGLKRVLGVIRPTTEIVGDYTLSGHIGVLATQGTVSSQSYVIEIQKFFPEVKVFQQACPLWVPLVESNEHDSPGADYFVEKYLRELTAQSPAIDTVVLACTHYPMLVGKIKQFLPGDVNLFMQGEVVANSLLDYLRRHPEIDRLCSKNGAQNFYTTGSTEDFNSKATTFLGRQVAAKHLEL